MALCLFAEQFVPAEALDAAVVGCRPWGGKALGIFHIGLCPEDVSKGF